jgi:DNA-binding NarL/FixJ family response regulator
MLVALCADLFFGARIRETAKQLAIPCEIVRDPDQLVARAAGARLVIVDMSLRAGDPASAVRALKARHPEIKVVGYLFDAQDELIRTARAAGCDKVLSRGGLTQKLPELLRPLAG